MSSYHTSIKSIIHSFYFTTHNNDCCYNNTSRYCAVMHGGILKIQVLIIIIMLKPISITSATNCQQSWTNARSHKITKKNTIFNKIEFEHIEFMRRFIYDRANIILTDVVFAHTVRNMRVLIS